jgi:hypothetical protein
MDAPPKMILIHLEDILAVLNGRNSIQDTTNVRDEIGWSRTLIFNTNNGVLKLPAKDGPER